MWGKEEKILKKRKKNLNLKTKKKETTSTTFKNMFGSDRYEKAEKIGEGTYGEVYRAKDTQS